MVFNLISALFLGLLAAFLSLLFGSFSLPLALGLALFIFFFVLVSRAPFWGVLLILFFLPFERLPTLEVRGLTLKINHLLGSATLIVWFLKILLERARIKFIWPDLSLALFLIFGLISAALAQNQSRAFSVLIFLFFAVLIYFLVRHFLGKEEVWSLALKIIFVTSFISVLFALYQFFGDFLGLSTGLDPGYTKAVYGFPRPQGFSKEPLYLAGFLFLPLGLSASLAMAKETILKKHYLIFFFASFLLVFLMTLSRGAFIGLAAMLLFFLIFKFRHIFTLKNLSYFAAALAVAGILLFLILGRLEPESKERFVFHATGGDIFVQQSGESVFGRIESFKKSLELYRAKPLLGIGPGNYGPAVKGYPATFEGRGWDIVNNQYLEILAEQGIIGLGLWLLFLIGILFVGIRAYLREEEGLRKTILGGLLAALVAVLVQYNFFSTLYIIYLWVLLGMVAALAYKSNKAPRLRSGQAIEQ